MPLESSGVMLCRGSTGVIEPPAGSALSRTSPMMGSPSRARCCVVGSSTPSITSIELLTLPTSSQRDPDVPLSACLDRTFLKPAHSVGTTSALGLEDASSSAQ